MVSIKSKANLDMEPEKAESRLKKAMESTVRSGETMAAQKAPVKSGRLKNSLDTRKIDDSTWAIVSPVKYSSAVEFGTEPRVITPDDAEALYWPGAEHPVKKVQHPGTEPQPFMRPALQHMVDIAPRKFEIYMSQG